MENNCNKRMTKKGILTLPIQDYQMNMTESIEHDRQIQIDEH